MTFEFTKCHGSGNDFILIDERQQARYFDADERRQMAQVLCDRQNGIGADGILFVQTDKHADGRMVIYNADGSEASMCGNGLRCVARCLAETTGLDVMKIATKGGVYDCEKVEHFFEDIDAYSIRIDTVDFDPALFMKGFGHHKVLAEQVDFLPADLEISALSVPNPHIVSYRAQPDTALLQAIGTSCNTDKTHFFDGVNVNFFTPISTDEIFVETFERGVGLTNACGTGMLAASLVAHLLHHIPEGKWIKVYNKGGMVHTRVSKEAERYVLELSGNATFLYDGKVTYDFTTQTFKAEKGISHDDEIAHYQKLVDFSTARVAKFYPQ
jgi:diaminopimelate epimerase